MTRVLVIDTMGTFAARETSCDAVLAAAGLPGGGLGLCTSLCAGHAVLVSSALSVEPSGRGSRTHRPLRAAWVVSRNPCMLN